MNKAIARAFDAYKDYNIDFDTDLLNMRIRIYGSEYESTGAIYYEGPVGRFIRERIPTEYIVELIAELRHKDTVSYRLSGGENFIQRV